MDGKICEHRYEVFFEIGAVGYGETKEDAIRDARTYGIDDFSYIQDNLTTTKVVRDTSMDSCYICEDGVS